MFLTCWVLNDCSKSGTELSIIRTWIHPILSSRISFGTRGILKILKTFPHSLYLVPQNQTNSLPFQYCVWGFNYFLFSLRDKWGSSSSRLLCWSLLRIPLRSRITNNNRTHSTNKLDVVRVCLSCYDFASLTDSLFLMPLTVSEKFVKHVFVTFPAIRCNLTTKRSSRKGKKRGTRHQITKRKIARLSCSFCEVLFIRIFILGLN